MSDAFAPPEQTPSPAPGGLDVHMMVLSALLGLWALGFGALTVLTGGGGLMIGILQPASPPGEPSPTAIAAMGLAESVLFGAFAVPALLAVVGLLTRHRWGFWLALVHMALWTGGCCVPLAFYGCWVLLRPAGRARFGY